MNGASVRREVDARMSFSPDAVWDLTCARFGRFEGAATIRSFFCDRKIARVERHASRAEALEADMSLPDHVGEIYHGHEGLVRAAERWTEPFDWMVVELEQIIDAENYLFSFHRWRAKARHTGIEINEPLVYRWSFRDGRVVHFRSLDPGEADVAALSRE
jgi:hypothetical protein